MSSSMSSSSYSSTDTIDSCSISDVETQGVVDQYVADILSCHSVFINLPHLEPCLAVNKAFSELMEICIRMPEESVVDAILKSPQIALIMLELQHICSSGECNLERYWAQKIVSTSQCENEAQSLLNSFPYYSNYIDLTRMELNALRSTSPSHSHQRFAFLGCGPLPLTSLCIFSQLSSSSAPPFILNIDRDATAVALATELCQRLDIPTTHMAFKCDSAGGAQNDLGLFDVVYVAALVGATTAEKREIFKRVLAQMRPGALLVVRTAHALRKLLYPAVETSTDLDPNIFEPLMVVHPYNHIVNSVIIGRVRASKLG